MQNTSNETARVILGNTRTKITLFIEEEYPTTHEATIGKTSEGMSETKSPAAEHFLNIAREAASAIVGGVMAAAVNNAQVLATIEKAIPEGPQREAYTRWLDQYRSYDPEGTCQIRVSQRHITNSLGILANRAKDVTFTLNTNQE
jgi:hypothetical protein